MNRYLTVPLVLSFVLFAGVYFSHTSYGQGKQANESLPASTEPASTEAVLEKKEAESETLLSYNDARTIVLDGWPTVGNYNWGSRAAVRIESYAELGETMMRPLAALQENKLGDDPSILTSLVLFNIYASPKDRSEKFPVHIDRQTKVVKIFDNNKWQSYSEWRETKLPVFMASSKPKLPVGARVVELTEQKSTTPDSATEVTEIANELMKSFKLGKK